MPLGNNRVLGNQHQPAEARPHRVALANWPATIDEPRTKTLDQLLGHTASSGYEGVEFGLEAMARKYFSGETLLVAARKLHHALDRFNLRQFGSTLHQRDEKIRERNWLGAFVDEMKCVQEMGGEYVSIQFFLHPDFLNTGGAYREDERYLQWCADHVARMRDAAWKLGLNFYLEVHVDRITEDPAACRRILQLATCEINGDMSHYLARGFVRGTHVENVLDHMGHTHVRMARQLGDLSAVVEDPAADWQQEGVTWQMFRFMMRGFKGGLSSRTIAGETGQMHLVVDTLTQDAALVPLYRAMARYADAAAQGISMAVEKPDDLKPWG